MKKQSQEVARRTSKGLRTLVFLCGSLVLALGGVFALATPAPEATPANPAAGIDPLTQARVAFADRDYPKAEALARQARDRYPDSKGARNLLGRILTERGRIAEACQLFSEVLKSSPEEVDALCGMAAALRRSGQGDAAASHLHHAAKLRPQDPQIWKELGLAQREKGDSMGALSSLQRSLDLDGKQEDLTSLITELATARPEIPGANPIPKLPGAGLVPNPPGADPRSTFAGPPRPRVPDPNDLFPKPSWKGR
jgi:tetratricopeptide (TPR) repeat protein